VDAAFDSTGETGGLESGNSARTRAAGRNSGKRLVYNTRADLKIGYTERIEVEEDKIFSTIDKGWSREQ
jgi:hypothetical protein